MTTFPRDTSTLFPGAGTDTLATTQNADAAALLLRFQFSSTRPTARANGDALVAGDLWINLTDESLYVWTGTTYQDINHAYYPVVTQNGESVTVTLYFDAAHTDEAYAFTFSVSDTEGSLTTVAHDTTLTGSGTTDSPLGLANASNYLQSIISNATLSGTGHTASPLQVAISPNTGNLLSAAANGLYASFTETFTSVASNASLSGSGTTGSPLQVAISADTGQSLVLRSDGLYVSAAGDDLDDVHGVVVFTDTESSFHSSAVDGTTIEIQSNGALSVGTITHNEMGTDAVHTENIMDGNVSTAKLDDDAVTQAKMAPGAIGNTEVASAAAIAVSKLNQTDTILTINGQAVHFGSTVTISRNNPAPATITVSEAYNFSHLVSGGNYTVTATVTVTGGNFVSITNATASQGTVSIDSEVMSVAISNASQGNLTLSYRVNYTPTDSDTPHVKDVTHTIPIQPRWYTQIATSDPANFNSATDNGAMVVGDTATFDNSSSSTARTAYVWVPTANYSSIIFETVHGYSIEKNDETETANGYRLLNLGTVEANQSVVIRIRSL